MIDRLDRDVRAELARVIPPDAAALQALAETWAELAGPAAAVHSMPQRLSADGTLVVSTSSSTWAYELGRLAPGFLKGFRARFGATAPRALRFTPGRLPEASPHAEPLRPEPPETTAEDRRAARELAAVLDDDTLRDLVARAAAAGLARARADRGF